MNKAAIPAPVLLRRRLLSWYDENRRAMPWRETPSPYRTWISEIMLQQTQVATVIPYFERFTARFPDAMSLARAKEADVMSLWAGLGYYSRARNLHAAAKKLAAERGGRLPDGVDELRGLPGIGPYTAGAIASIAFDRPEPLVDGNVARVLSRLTAFRKPVKEAASLKKLWALAGELIAGAARPGDHNQALMELGATVCLPAPEPPKCGLCPWRGGCRAHALGLEDSIPDTGPKRPPVDMAWTALEIEDSGKVLLWRRADSEKFLPGHWGLPETRHLKTVEAGKLLRRVRHAITHHRITLEVRAARWPGGAPPRQARWFGKARLREVLVSSLWRKALAAAGT